MKKRFYKSRMICLLMLFAFNFLKAEVIQANLTIEKILSNIDKKTIVNSNLGNVPYSKQKLNQSDSLSEFIEKLVLTTTRNKLYNELVKSYVTPFFKEKNIKSIDFIGFILSESICDIFILNKNEIYHLEILKNENLSKNKTSIIYISNTNEKIKNLLKEIKETPKKHYSAVSSGTQDYAYIINSKSNEYESYFYERWGVSKSDIIDLLNYLSDFVLQIKKNNGVELKPRMIFI